MKDMIEFLLRNPMLVLIILLLLALGWANWPRLPRG
jgi:hypothetical protein